MTPEYGAGTLTVVGLALAVADFALPGPAPDGMTVLGVTMIGFGLAMLALLKEDSRG